jgi:hypothetical protein
MAHQRFWEYVVTVARWYKGHISGWLLAVIAIALNIAAAIYADDPSKAADIIRWSARITIAAAVYVFLVAQYDAWKEQRDKIEELRSDLPRFEIAIEQMSTGNIQGAVGTENLANLTYAAPLIRILNLGSQSVITWIWFSVFRPDGSVIEGKSLTPPPALVQTNAHGKSLEIPFGEWLLDYNIKPIQKGTIARGRLFVYYPDLTQGMIGGPGFKYEIRIRDAWYPQTREYTASMDWRTADSMLTTFPGMGIQSRRIDPANNT